MHKGIQYIVLSYIQGCRISQQMDAYRKNQILYCNKFGENIGRIHKDEKRNKENNRGRNAIAVRLP
jgi:tRNA A-37 threonylcarbamoyl transferase component Bud32